MSQHNGHAPNSQGESNSEMSFYAEEVQEVLGRMPTWMEKSGNMLLLMLVVIGLVAGWTIHYPDSIQSNARLIPAQPAINLHVQTPVVLQAVLAADKQSVGSGAPILQATGTDGTRVVLKSSRAGIIHFLVQMVPGDTLRPDMALAALAPSGQSPHVVAYVDESQYNQISLGQKALVKTGNAQRLFGGALAGKVNRKAIAATNGFYEIGITLDEPCEPIVAPEPVSATIILKDYKLIQRILHI